MVVGTFLSTGIFSEFFKSQVSSHSLSPLFHYFCTPQRLTIHFYIFSYLTYCILAKRCIHMMETVQRIGLINLVTSVLLARKQEVARTITRINRQKKNMTDT